MPRNGTQGRARANINGELIAANLLNGPANPELPHTRLQRRTLHSQDGRGPLGPGDPPLGLPQSAQNMLPFSFFERGNGRGRIRTRGGD
jgi:hypothetical protein